MAAEVNMEETQTPTEMKQENSDVTALTSTDADATVPATDAEPLTVEGAPQYLISILCIAITHQWIYH